MSSPLLSERMNAAQDAVAAGEIGSIKEFVAPDGWTPVRVTWLDEPGRERIVAQACSTCLPDGELPLYVAVVSPDGVAHESQRGDTTDCGHDCTGDDWWHRL